MRFLASTRLVWLFNRFWGGIVEFFSSVTIHDVTDVFSFCPLLFPAATPAPPTGQLDKKGEEARRAAATERAALAYLQQKRGGNEKASVKDCCDAAAAETGYPRPAETSVRRLLPKLMTDEEKSEKKRHDEKVELRAAATRAAATLYRQANGDGDGEVVMSVTRCCNTAEERHGIRPAETSVRRVLARMYEEEGIEPKKKKVRPTPKPKAADPQVTAQHDLEILRAYQPNQQALSAAEDYVQENAHLQLQPNQQLVHPVAGDYPQDATHLQPSDHQQMDLSAAAGALLQVQDASVPPNMPPLPPPDDPDVDVVAI